MNLSEEQKGVKPSDRRAHPRQACELPDTKGQTIRDLSLGGAYLISRLNYHPNEKIPLDFTLPSGQAKLHLQARVVRGEAQPNSTKVGYGLAFESLESEDLKNINRYLQNQTPITSQNLKIIKGEKYRQTRYGADFLAGLKPHCFVSVENKRVEGTIQNFSKYGVSVVFEEALEWVPGGKIKNIHLLLEEKEIFRGPVIVRHYQKRGKFYEYGFEFSGSFLDVEKAFAVKEYNLIEKNLSGFREKLILTQQIKPDFKIAMGDLHYVLENLKKSLEKDESKLLQIGDPLKRKALENDCLELVDVQFRRKVHDLMSIMEEIVRDLSAEERQLYVQYCRDMLLDYFHDASFVKRAFFRPLGYAGDYETMNLIYNAPHGGNTLWQKVVNHLLWTLPTNQAVRNRSQYLSEKIRKIASKASRETKNIMSLACGPCKEIQILLSDQESFSPKSNISFHLVDQDAHALSYSNNVLGELNLKRKKKIDLNYYQNSVADFLKNPDIRKKFPKQDLIYTAGLFDYLPDDVAELLIGICYFMLKPGGSLIVGNFSPFNPYRLAQEFALDWFLLYRDEQELKKLVPKFLKCSKVDVEEEATHINLFLNVTKSHDAESEG
jgi:extracellular factor (EF) 3-hydroxypalmitic acid methyl ester biosynthesis protein